MRVDHPGGAYNEESACVRDDGSEKLKWPSQILCCVCVCVCTTKPTFKVEGCFTCGGQSKTE